jgi:glucosamine--fructose-6-phosphate aminotransferase (isomerizing)
VAAVTGYLQGSWALAVTIRGFDGVVLARHHSPLLVGEAADLRMAASDQLGLDPRIGAARELAEGDIVVLADRIWWFDRDVTPVAPRQPWAITTRPQTMELAGAADFTAKEIDEQAMMAQQLVDTLAGGLRRGRLLADLGLPARSRIRLVACGSSAYAARVIEHTLTAARIPTQIVTASEHSGTVTEPDTLTVAISQSGETADLLSALDGCTDPLLALTNHPQSTLARRADAVLELRCGPEIGVAATKSFTAQVIAGAAFALSLGSALGRLDDVELAGIEALLGGIPARLAATGRQVAGPAAALAAALAEYPGWVFASRGAGVPYALEGALKLKELAYRWTEALPAGELKHGPIALIQPGTPVVIVQAEPVARLAVNARELAARGAQIITVGPGEDAVLPVVAPHRQPPWGPLESVVALQHLARETAHHLGYNVDRPRNLAKSVTVE